MIALSQRFEKTPRRVSWEYLLRAGSWSNTSGFAGISDSRDLSRTKKPLRRLAQWLLCSIHRYSKAYSSPLRRLRARRVFLLRKLPKTSIATAKPKAMISSVQYSSA